MIRLKTDNEPDAKIRMRISLLFRSIRIDFSSNGVVTTLKELLISVSSFPCIGFVIHSAFHCDTDGRYITRYSTFQSRNSLQRSYGFLHEQFPEVPDLVRASAAPPTSLSGRPFTASPITPFVIVLAEILEIDPFAYFVICPFKTAL